ncbi:hypothetical protein B0H10DRAFT_1958439 [Mycena sp. CBHHK59/15]|nr:hypothetical protein B0H10DRAFT_1958439 [Mycena sp. CBHHK59/15]
MPVGGSGRKWGRERPEVTGSGRIDWSGGVWGTGNCRAVDSTVARSGRKWPGVAGSGGRIDGILFTDAYSTISDSYLALADHKHVDDILSAGSVTVPSVSANPIPVMQCLSILSQNLDPGSFSLS